MKFDILTIFPEMFPCYFNTSMMAKAIEDDLIEVNVHDLRDWATDKHKTIDDVAYGGVTGMVMKVEPIYRAVKELKEKYKDEKIKVILLSAGGEVLKQKKVRSLSDYDRLILIAGHYKGVDGRVTEHIIDEEIAVGEYVITGGEVPAMLVVDAVSRMVPGVIGNPESKEGESHSPGVEKEHEVYTRPEKFKTDKGEEWSVPEVLVSGHHQKIEEWRQEHREYTDESEN